MRQLIKTDGTLVDLPGPVSLDAIGKLIGADTMDTVLMRHMGLPLHVMCVNDRGYQTEVVKSEHDGVSNIELRPLHALLPLNQEATRLYHLNCKPDTAHQIVGDVVIVPDDDFALAENDV